MLPGAAILAALAAVAHGAVVGTRTTAAAAALCSQYAYQSVNGYELLNNLWGMSSSGTSGSQCTNYDGPAGSGIAFSSTWQWKGDQNTVKSYIYAGRQFTRKKVSDIRSLPTTVQWSYNTTDQRANVAYDIFTSTDPNHANSSGDFELMIWLQRYGGIWPITDSSTGSPAASVKVAGYTWDLFTGYNGAMRVYSFVVPNGSPIYSFNADVKEFFNYLTTNQNFPASQQYMLIYQFGTEAFVGGPTKFTVSKFQADVN